MEGSLPRSLCRSIANIFPLHFHSIGGGVSLPPFLNRLAPSHSLSPFECVPRSLSLARYFDIIRTRLSEHACEPASAALSAEKSSHDWKLAAICGGVS